MRKGHGMVNGRWVLVIVICLIASDTIFGGSPVSMSQEEDISEILAHPTDTSVTISLHSEQELVAYYRYGFEPSKLSSQTETVICPAGKTAPIVLDKLQSDTRYYYRLYSRTAGDDNFEQGEVRTLHTQRAKGKVFTFAIQADSHLDENTSEPLYRQNLNNIAAGKPDFLIDLGDTFMTDKHRPYQTAHKQYLAQRVLLGKLCNSIPLFLVLGNHDGESGRWLDGTDDNMTVWSAGLRKQLFPNPAPDSFYSGNIAIEKFIGPPENYYAWEWGDALYIVLDPYRYTVQRSRRDRDNWSRTLGKTQYDWLKETLESSNSAHKFIFIHNLVGGLDRSMRGGAEAASLFEWGGRNLHGDVEFYERRAGWELPIHQLLVRNGVSAVFHGHDHFFAKQDMDGIVYQLVPQPGHPGGRTVRNADEYGYRAGDMVPGSGHLRVTVTPNMCTVDFIRAILPQKDHAGMSNGDIAYTYLID